MQYEGNVLTPSSPVDRRAPGDGGAETGRSHYRGCCSILNDTIILRRLNMETEGGGVGMSVQRIAHCLFWSHVMAADTRVAACSGVCDGDAGWTAKFSSRCDPRSVMKTMSGATKSAHFSWFVFPVMFCSLLMVYFLFLQKQAGSLFALYFVSISQTASNAINAQHLE
ncbi:hypothetical protein ATANTOWER_009295 [Ataeniobius toweri]|uniref:Uncharacterized protein n=1 Tax=Ataeniobius toweri TaxID=208326 RepID=A0ABU7A597_9TELE|nr:hypothetical protein [Ataeniobius toweri]